MGNIDYEGEILLILLNILVTSFVCLAFVVCFRSREVKIPKKMMYRDGGSDSDELQPLLPVGNQMDGCWLDFRKKVWVNPKGVVVHLAPSCERINHGRCKELGICLGCIDCLKSVKKRPKDNLSFYTNCSLSSPYFHEGVKKFVTYRGVEVVSDVPVCFGFVLSFS